MTTRVLFICKKRHAPYGNSIGLFTSAQFLANYLSKNYGIDCKVVAVVDSNGIDKEVHDYKPTHVVIHALWVPAYKLDELTNLYPNIDWLIRIHSKIPFLANEGMAMEWLKDYQALKRKNLTISANSEEATRALDITTNPGTIYLPNVYDPSYDPKPIVKTQQMSINVGCFGAIRPLKNHLIQAMAAIAYGDKHKKWVRFHINGTRMEQKGEPVLKNLRALFMGTPHTLVEVPWYDHEDFLSIVSSMDIGMQVSLSETFNIVAADFVYCNVPVVVSPEINWMPFYAKADPNNIDSIVETLCYNHSPRWAITWLNKRALNSFNKESGHIWLKYLR